MDIGNVFFSFEGIKNEINELEVKIKELDKKRKFLIETKKLYIKVLDDLNKKYDDTLYKDNLETQRVVELSDKLKVSELQIKNNINVIDDKNKELESLKEELANLTEEYESRLLFLRTQLYEFCAKKYLKDNNIKISVI